MRSCVSLFLATCFLPGIVEAQTLPRWSQKGHTDTVNAVAFSPDGKTLASGGSDDAVILWNVADGKSSQTLKGHDDSVVGLAFSQNGKLPLAGC